MAAIDLVDAYVAALPGDTRRVARGEWGITVGPEQAGGRPLDVGVRLADGLLSAQAFATPAREDVNPWTLLHWNRGTRHVRFACTRAGDIWVHGDLPVAAVDERAVDRLLGLVVEAAIAVREYVAAKDAAPQPERDGWLPAG
ncbi:MAG: YbjN domain-containing protein [Thermoleophilaceae bacterium]|nr:YbjN domain-containing protein [Thermoleophilaceae bacterium]